MKPRTLFLLALAGAFTLVRGPSWPGMGARYDTGSKGGPKPARPSAPGPSTPIDQWRALDRGEDPTLRE